MIIFLQNTTNNRKQPKIINGNSHHHVNHMTTTTTTTIKMNLRNRTLKIPSTSSIMSVKKDENFNENLQQQLSADGSSLKCPLSPSTFPKQTATISSSMSDTKNLKEQQTTILTKTVRQRRSNRRQNKSSIFDGKDSIAQSDPMNQSLPFEESLSTNQTSSTTINSSSSSSSRSIQSFFPLKTIGGVCELFRSQLDPRIDTNDQDNIGRSEPNLTLLSIVLGIIETSLTRGLFVDQTDSNTTSLNDSSMTTQLTEAIDDSSKQQQHSKQSSTMNNDHGSYSPAEASIAPAIISSNKNNNCSHDNRNNNNNNSINNNNLVNHNNNNNQNEIINIIHTPLDIPIPTVNYEMVENLQKKFEQHIKESIDLDKFVETRPNTVNIDEEEDTSKHQSMNNNDDEQKQINSNNDNTRELIKKISELIWSNLHRSHYKDRAHIQTIYSYINDNKLDCYGVAYTVIAACQILNLNDVHLVMSEDHAWVAYGDGETCEVTWHGKCGNDDRLGQSIPTTSESLNCWLYLNGNTMKCNRFEIVATLVSAMNLSINATQDSEELAILQQHLLWILYDYGYLERYPMALGNLGDIEDACSIHSNTARKHPLELFNEAIESAKKYYNDYHVYPYTYLGGYYFRKRKFKQALQAYSNAAQVIMKYNYTRDDEEIYKEFQEISNDLIPYIIKYTTTSILNDNSNISKESSSLVNDPECFILLLKFYDGLCAWEEDSSTPVLHIGWTKPIVSSISKFPYQTRSKIRIKFDPTRNPKHQSFNRTFQMDNSNHSNNNNTNNNNNNLEFDDLHNNNHNNNNENNENHNLIINYNGNNTSIVNRERRRRRAASFSQQQQQQQQQSILIMKPVIKQEDNSIVVGDQRKCLKDNSVNDQKDNDDNDDSIENNGKIVTTLVSRKFDGIKNLLTADKLNTSAIQLQLTAQSQVNIFSHNKSRNSIHHNHNHGINNRFVAGKSEMDHVLSSSTTINSSKVVTTAASSVEVSHSPHSPMIINQQQQPQQQQQQRTNSNKRLRRE